MNITDEQKKFILTEIYNFLWYNVSALICLLVFVMVFSLNRFK